MPRVRVKTITIGRFFEFDVPPKFAVYRFAYSESHYVLKSLMPWDGGFNVDCAAPGTKSRPGPVDEEKEFQDWATIFGDFASEPDAVAVRPFGPDPGACALPCWTFEIQTPPEKVFCGAVIRNAGGVLAVYGSANSTENVATLRWLLKTIRTPAANPSATRRTDSPAKRAVTASRRPAGSSPRSPRSRGHKA